MKINSDKRQVLRYFRYFFIMLLLATLVLTGFQYVSANRMLKTNAMTNSRNAFVLLKNSHDIIFRQIENSLSSLFNNTQFQYFMDYYHNNRVNQIIDINTQLNSVVAQISTIECLGLYYPKDGYTLSSNQSVSRLELYHDKEFLLELEHIDLRQRNTFVREVWYALKNAPTTVITIVRTLPAYYTGFTPDAYVIIDIKLSTILAAFEQITIDNNASMMIYDESGMSISAIGASYDIADLLGDDQDLASDIIISKNLRLGGEDMLAYYVKSAETRWTYVYLQRADEVNERLLLMRNSFFIVCIGVLAFGVVFSWRASRKLYSPIQRISEKLGNPEADVFERIDQVMLRNERLDHELQDNLITGRNRQLLQRMLLGPATAEHANAHLPLNQSEKECAVLLLDICDEYDELSHEGLKSMLQPHGVRLLFCLYTRWNELAIIIAGVELKDEVLTKSADAILTAIAQHGKFSIGTSAPFATPEMISDAYRQAADALGMRIVRGPGTICCFREIRYRSSLTYPLMIENAILHALKTQKTDNVRAEMDRFEAFLVSNDASAQIVRDFYMQLFCSSQRLMPDLLGNQDSLAAFNHQDLLGLSSISEMSAYMMRLYEQFIKTRMSDDPRAEMIRKVCRHIEANLQNLPTIDTIASEFQISPSYLRTEFQRVCGVSIKGYTDQVRAEKAKALLAESSMKVQDVAQALGFNYTQSFITFFRAATAMTPGEYRLWARTRQFPN